LRTCAMPRAKCQIAVGNGSVDPVFREFAY
jgi:hypothetical protein